MKKLYVLTGTEFAILESWKDFLKMVDEEKDLSPKQKAYQSLMLYYLDEFGVDTPADLDDEQKKDFFDKVAKNWDKGTGKIKDKEIQKKIDAAIKDGDIDDPEKA